MGLLKREVKDYFPRSIKDYDGYLEWIKTQIEEKKNEKLKNDFELAQQAVSDVDMSAEDKQSLAINTDTW